MTDSHKAMLQRAAKNVYELRREQAIAQQEMDKASERHRDIGERLRIEEAKLTQTVGPNIPRKMWIVDSGVAVVAHHLNNMNTMISVLDAEDTE